MRKTVLRIRIRDAVPFWPLDAGSGMGKKSRSGSGMNIPDHVAESAETLFRVEFFDADPDPRTFWALIRVGKNSDPGSGINITIFWVEILKFFDADQESFWSWIRDWKIRIRDKHLGSRTLPVGYYL
jgi:hypothetical protein